MVGAGSGTRLPRVHRTGRVCTEDGCETLLSIYNPSEHCAVHAVVPTRPRRRRRRTAAAADSD